MTPKTEKPREWYLGFGTSLGVAIYTPIQFSILAETDHKKDLIKVIEASAVEQLEQELKTEKFIKETFAKSTVQLSEDNANLTSKLVAAEEKLAKAKEGLEQIKLGIEPEPYKYDEQLEDHLHKAFTGLTASKYAGSILKEINKE